MRIIGRGKIHNDRLVWFQGFARGRPHICGVFDPDSFNAETLGDLHKARTGIFRGDSTLGRLEIQDVPEAGTFHRHASDGDFIVLGHFHHVQGHHGPAPIDRAT